MQLCTKCQIQSPDEATHCVNCKSDLSEYSKTAVTLNQYLANPRVKHVYVIGYDNCCPACQEALGSYAKTAVPRLPVEGCSHGNGCRCYYQPFLDELYP